MEALGKTASITLITGIPGSGKTLRLVYWISQAIEAGQAVYCCNVNGLKVPGAIPWENPHEWRDIPAGSVLVVDEAQMFFRARRSGDVPEYITAMETIRHAGIRLVLVTQQPNYLDTHLRGLVGLHEHLVRANGKGASIIYRANSVMDEVRSKRSLEAQDKETWNHPAKYFAWYTSAEVHTVGYVMPARLKLALKVIPLCVLAFVGVWWSVFSDAKAKRDHKGDAAPMQQSAALAPGSAPAPGASAVKRNGSELGGATPEALAASLVPRIPGAPWSAPIYEGRSVQAIPRTFCMATEDSCTCLSEQGTVVNQAADLCAFQARHGERYDPTRMPDQVREEPAPMLPPETALAVPAVAGAVVPGVAVEPPRPTPLTR